MKPECGECGTDLRWGALVDCPNCAEALRSDASGPDAAIRAVLKVLHKHACDQRCDLACDDGFTIKVESYCV